MTSRCHGVTRLVISLTDPDVAKEFTITTSRPAVYVKPEEYPTSVPTRGHMKATPCRRLDPVTMQVIEILPARALTPTRKERRAARRVAFERQQADAEEAVPPPSCETVNTDTEAP